MSERPTIQTGTVRWEPVAWADIRPGDRIAPLASWTLDVVAVAVEGIKDQDEKIHALEKENEALRTKLGGLEAQLAALAMQVERLASGEARKE